jgi:hypothetical protein
MTITRPGLGAKSTQQQVHVLAGSLDHLALTPGSSSILSGDLKTFTVTGYDRFGNSLGDVTASTTFTISPDGACGANACTAGRAGAHAVNAVDGPARGSATLTVTAAIYWLDNTGTTIGRANVDGSGANRSFITVATTFVDGASYVAVDSAHIYWAKNNSIGRANLDGSGVVDKFITGVSCGYGVALDDAHIYWSNNCSGSIGRANLDGSGVNQSFIPAPTPTGVAVDSAHIYWVSAGQNTLGRANLDGSGANQSFVTGLDTPFDVVVDSAHIYWTNRGFQIPLVTTIGRANLDGSGVKQNFISGVTTPVGLAADSAHLYWQNDGTGIGRANLDGSGTNLSFITGLTNATGVAVTVG